MYMYKTPSIPLGSMTEATYNNCTSVNGVGAWRMASYRNFWIGARSVQVRAIPEVQDLNSEI